MPYAAAINSMYDPAMIVQAGGRSPKTLPASSLRDEQRRATSFITDRDQWLLFADVGTGKTVVMLNALQAHLESGKIKRAIVFAPKRVCMQVWLQEIKAWEHLDATTFCPGLLTGKNPNSRKLMIKNQRYKLLIANYELMPWIMKEFPDGIPGGDAIIFDEIDKMKSHTSLRWKGKYMKLGPRQEEMYETIGKPVKYIKRLSLMTVLLHPGAEHWVTNFKIRGGATGTPTPNHLSELWAQVYLIDRGNALGKEYEHFMSFFFHPANAYNKYAKREPRNPALMYRLIGNITFHMSHAEDMPQVVENDVRWVNLSPAAFKEYKKFEREALLVLEGEEVEAIAAAALWQKCRQLSSGFAYAETEAKWLDDCKHKELKSLVSELQGQQAIVVYDYRAQAHRLSQEFPHMKHLNGETRDSEANAIISSWNNGNLELLGLHPKSAGHGLNLQKSQAHHIIFLTLPMSAGEYKQVVGRLARRGGAEHVFVHKILSENTQDHEDLLRVEGKIETLLELLQAMKERTSRRN